MFYVYFDDDYAINGGIELKSFSSISQAFKFIEKRMKEKNSYLNNYTLIEGKQIPLKAAITKIQRADQS